MQGRSLDRPFFFAEWCRIICRWVEVTFVTIIDRYDIYYPEACA